MGKVLLGSAVTPAASLHLRCAKMGRCCILEPAAILSDFVQSSVVFIWNSQISSEMP
jgi:hypothetical protein